MDFRLCEWRSVLARAFNYLIVCLDSIISSLLVEISKASLYWLHRYSCFVTSASKHLIAEMHDTALSLCRSPYESPTAGFILIFISLFVKVYSLRSLDSEHRNL